MGDIDSCVESDLIPDFVGLRDDDIAKLLIPDRALKKVDVVAFEPEADPADIDVATRKLRLSTAERRRVKVAKLKLQRDADAKLEEQDELGRWTITAALPRARRAYESYLRLPVGCSWDSQIVHSSAGVSGWAKFADVMIQDARI